jgi:hypothetical protein
MDSFVGYSQQPPFESAYKYICSVFKQSDNQQEIKILDEKGSFTAIRYHLKLLLNLDCQSV